MVFVKVLMDWKPEQLPKIMLQRKTALSILYVRLIRDSDNAPYFCNVYEHFINILLVVNGCFTKFS